MNLKRKKGKKASEFASRCNFGLMMSPRVVSQRHRLVLTVHHSHCCAQTSLVASDFYKLLPFSQKLKVMWTSMVCT